MTGLIANLQHIRKTLYASVLSESLLRCGFHLLALANKGFETEGFKDLMSVLFREVISYPLTFKN